jgi:hypothetical protein
VRRASNDCKKCPLSDQSHTSTSLPPHLSIYLSLNLSPVIIQGPQATWNTEPNTCKLSFILTDKKATVNKFCASLVPLSDSPSRQAELIALIEDDVNNKITHSTTIETFTMAAKEAPANYLDSDQLKIAKKKPDAVLTFARLLSSDDAAYVYVASVPGQCSQSSAACGHISIVLDGNKRNSSIQSGKKNEMILKFELQNVNAAAAAIPASLATDTTFPAPSTLPLVLPVASSELVAKWASENEGIAAKKAVEAMEKKAAMSAMEEAAAALRIDLKAAAASEPTTTGTAAGAAEGEESTEIAETVVNPWAVTGKVDYNALIDDFGSQRLTPEILAKLASAMKTKELHRFLRRDIFFSHRDFTKLLDLSISEKEKSVESGGVPKAPFFLYTGR